MYRLYSDEKLYKKHEKVTWSSEYCEKGSRFILRVPQNRIGSWGMIVILERRSCKPEGVVNANHEDVTQCQR